MTKQKTIVDLQEIITVAREVYRGYRNEGREEEAKKVRVKIKFLEEKVEEIIKAEFSAWAEDVVELVEQLSDIQGEVKEAIDEVEAVQDKLDKFVDIVKKIDDAIKIAFDIAGKVL